MGQSSSEPPRPFRTVHRPPQVVLHDRLIPFLFNLEPLPDEILLVVLSYVPSRDLLRHGRCVSRRWKQLIDSPTLWRLKCEHEHKTEVLRVADLCHNIPWQRVYIKDPLSRNLLRNPCGTEQFNHWDIVNGGDGWAIEDNYSALEGASSQKCFVASFFWCQKSQMIDLLKEGLWEHLLDVHQPIIQVSDWFGARDDCGCVYEIKVQLLAANRRTVIREFTQRPDPIPQWNDTNYHQVSYKFRGYGPGVRYVNFTHKGKDTQFWKGWYGARITNSSVTIKCSHIEPCAQDG